MFPSSTSRPTAPATRRRSAAAAVGQARRAASTGIDYFRTMENLAQTITRLLAPALDLPEDFFDDTFDRHISRLRVGNYPETSEPPVPGQIRAGAHIDRAAGSRSAQANTCVAGSSAPRRISAADQEIRERSGDADTTCHKLAAPQHGQGSLSRCSLKFPSRPLSRPTRPHGSSARPRCQSHQAHSA